MTDIELHIQTGSGEGASPLADAWLYLLDGSAVTRLRTNSHGHALAISPDGDRDTATDYRQHHIVGVGDTLQLCHSLDTLAISDAALNRHTDVFAERVVPEGSLAPAQGTVAVSPDNTNTLAPTEAAIVSVSLTAVVVTAPQALALWPVFWSLHDDAYHTDGLNQGAALVVDGSLTLTENDPAPAPSGAARPQVRAFRIEGTITGSATRIRISLHNAQDAAIGLRANGLATTEVQEIDATVSGSSFTADVLLGAPDTAFGEVDIDVVAENGTARALATSSGLLFGAQAAMVNDRLADANGQQAGAQRGEADEVIVVDFMVSPQPDLPAITAQIRARRMLADDIETRDRPLSAALATVVAQPEMPLWMVELHLLGVTSARVQALLQRRTAAALGLANEVRVSTQWSITLGWDGPNSAQATRPYSYSETFPAAAPVPTHTVRFTLDPGTGDVAAALSPRPTTPTFPVAARRGAVVDMNTTRVWGRAAGAPTVDGTVVEFQPLIVDSAGREIMRGGDATLAVHNLQIDGVVVDAGLDTNGAGFVAAPVDPVVKCPTLRVRGVNPVAADVPAMIDVVVQEFFDAHVGSAAVSMLALDQWQITVRSIIAVESIGNHQFEHRPAGRFRFAGRRHGIEHDMPIFGPPAGYGLGQLDSPPVTEDQAFSYLDNLRGSVRLIMRDKANAAHRFMAANLPAAPGDIDRAAFRREVVRRYNGGTEVRFRNHTWELFPTSPTSRIEYPNAVLGTTVPYTAPRVAVPFVIAQFGPGF